VTGWSLARAADVFVKICGITTDDALAAAVAAGADAVGFVFAESVRKVSPARAAELCTSLPPGITRIAVMRHPDAATLADVFETFAPDWLQSDAEDFLAIALPAGCEPLPVYRNGRLPPAFRMADRATAPRPGGTGAPASALPQADGGRSVIPARLLFEGTASGTGQTADWNEAKALAARAELVLAGGLDPDNVAAAIRHVQPWGVDVSTGVEQRRGIKDPDKIAAFVARVRAMESER
jgi:phosphoribosylanthranilate isomerase